MDIKKILNSDKEEKKSVKDTIEELIKFRKNENLKGLFIKEMKEEGQRF